MAVVYTMPPNRSIPPYPREQKTVLSSVESQKLVHQLRAHLQRNAIAACDGFALVKENLSQKIPAVSMSQPDEHINVLDLKRANLPLKKFSF